MFDNKKILILGMARSGYEVAKLLHEKNCDITITDMQDQDENKINELESLGIKVIITKEQTNLLDNTFDYLIKNPGVPIDAPLILKANNLNIPVTNEVEVAFNYLPDNVKIIGITGSNGKTTITTIIYNILKEAGLPVHFGGNIGIPASSLIKDIKEGDYLVIEVSSHQLHDFHQFKTDISILSNISETHLEHFYTYDAYKKSKLKIFNNHTNKDIAIINKGDTESLNLTKDIKSNKTYFSSNSEADAYIKDNQLYYKDEMIINIDDIKIKGIHNYENILCSIIACKHYEISNDVIRNVLTTFKGVEHRIEFVKELNNRKFYNDSKSTNVLATKTALLSFEEPVILLLGGVNRNQKLEDLLPYMNYVKKIVTYGDIKDYVKEFATKYNYKCDIEEDLKNTTINAYESSKEGDIILLSPACASWDQYKDFEERGKDFKNVIETLN